MKWFIRSCFFLLVSCMLTFASCTSETAEVSFANYPSYTPLENPFEADLVRNNAIHSLLDTKPFFNEVLRSEENPGLEGFEFDLYGNKQKTLLWEGAVPFARYWQLKDQEAYVFHPMVFGKYLCLNRDQRDSIEDAFALANQFYFQDSTGIAFYYPERYPLSRMKGPEVAYSAISQGEILAGYARLDSADSVYDSTREAILDGLLLDYYDGGVNLSDQALLEMPLYRSAPEIILNGWLHALWHLNDYARVYDDPEVDSILKQNFDFLANHINDWYIDSLHISTYSNLSPYQGVIRFDEDMKVEDGDVRIEYASKQEDLRDQFVPLEVGLFENFGAHDNMVEVKSEREARIQLNVSSLFASSVVASKPFTLKLMSGGYDPVKSSPTSDGQKMEFISEQHGDQWVVCLEEAESLLWKGYPTNFNKADGKNHYHVQHIVGLLYLAHFGKDISLQHKAKLLSTATKWYEETSEYEGLENAVFESPEAVFTNIMKGKLIQDVASFDALLKKSGITPQW